MKIKRDRFNSGQALVTVIFVVAILTAVAVMLTTRSIRQFRDASANLRELQAQTVAYGAVNYVANELQQITLNGATPPLNYTPPPNTDNNGWTQFSNGWYKVDFVDTASRLNINTASLNELEQMPNITTDIASAIVDWRSSGEQTSANGAKSDYYQSLPTPYNSKDAPLDSIGELLLVKGITPSVLYGPFASYGVPNTTNPNSPSASTGIGNQAFSLFGQSAAPPGGLSELLTTYSQELNVASDGTPRVDLQTASESTLTQQLQLPSNVVSNLINYRNNNSSSFNSMADLANVSGFSKQVLSQIADRITMTSGQYRNGVIDINDCSPYVLATIPGINSDTINAIMQFRAAGEQFTSLNDLFQLSGITEQQLLNLLDYVCVKSSAYLIHVRVILNGSRAIYGYVAMVELGAPSTASGSSTGSSGSSGSPSSASTANSASSSTPTPSVLIWRQVPEFPGWEFWQMNSATGGYLGNSSPSATGGTRNTNPGY